MCVYICSAVYIYIHTHTHTIYMYIYIKLYFTILTEHISSRERGQETCQPKDHVTCTHLHYCYCSTRDCGNGMRGAALSLLLYH